MLPIWAGGCLCWPISCQHSMYWVVPSIHVDNISPVSASDSSRSYYDMIVEPLLLLSSDQAARLNLQERDLTNMYLAPWCRSKFSLCLRLFSSSFFCHCLCLWNLRNTFAPQHRNCSNSEGLYPMCRGVVGRLIEQGRGHLLCSTIS